MHTTITSFFSVCPRKWFKRNHKNQTWLSFFLLQFYLPVFSLFFSLFDRMKWHRLGKRKEKSIEFYLLSKWVFVASVVIELAFVYLSLLSSRMCRFMFYFTYTVTIRHPFILCECVEQCIYIKKNVCVLLRTATFLLSTFILVRLSRSTLIPDLSIFLRSFFCCCCLRAFSSFILSPLFKCMILSRSFVLEHGTIRSEHTFR